MKFGIGVLYQKLCGVRFVKFGIVVLYQKLCGVNFVKFGIIVLYQKLWCEFREIWYRSSVPKLSCVSFVKFGIGVLYQKLCSVSFVDFGIGVPYQNLCEFRGIRRSEGHTVRESVNSFLPRNFYISWQILVKFCINHHHTLPFSDCDFHKKKSCEAMNEILPIYVHFFV